MRINAILKLVFNGKIWFLRDSNNENIAYDASAENIAATIIKDYPAVANDIRISSQVYADPSLLDISGTDPSQQKGFITKFLNKLGIDTGDENNIDDEDDNEEQEDRPEKVQKQSSLNKKKKKQRPESNIRSSFNNSMHKK